MDQSASKVARLWKDGDGIVWVVHLPDVEITLADARETMAAYLEVWGGKRCPMLVDTKTIRSISREARSFYAGAEAALVTSAVALVVGTPVSRVLGNFYLGVSRPRIPSRLFTSEAEALAWLKTYLE